MPIRSHRAIVAATACVTHWPISTICPVSSARGRKLPGRRSPSRGCRQRSSASAATIGPHEPFAPMPTCGWNTSVNWPSSIAARRSLSSVARAAICAASASLKCSTRPRPEALA